MVMDILHFQPGATLEDLMTQTLGCIQTWHRDVMKRYAEYSTDAAPAQAGHSRNVYKQGMPASGGGVWQSISFDTISGMTAQEGAMLQANVKRGMGID